VPAVIVAGGSGYIGQEVLRAALSTHDSCYKGAERVINIDIKPPRPLHARLKQRGDYFDINDHPRLKFIQADLSDPESTAAAFDEAERWGGDVQGVANLSGLVKYGHGDEKLFGPNVQTVRNLAEESAKRKLLMIHFSGTAIHGNKLTAAVKESDRIGPVESYGRSKTASEKAIFDCVRDKGLRAIVFRSTAPVGPDLQASELNKMYETIVNAPVIPAVKNSNNTYVSTEDVGRTFMFSMAHSATVVNSQPAQPSDIAYNLGASRPFSDAQVMSHLQQSVYGKVSKPILQLPSRVVVTASYFMTAAARGASFVMRKPIEPVIHSDLAKLFIGWHCQDPARFESVFPPQGFTLKHREPEDVLDVGTVFKFLTDWTERKPPGRIDALSKQFLAERTRAAYE
jgi:nucleoside-diphosphate-sugar epimerase